MKAEIVAIGSELTSGAKLDTNSQWLSLELAELGIPVAYHTTMSDSLEAMIEVFRIAAGRCELVLITGGLGPTLDDITRDALAALEAVELVLDEACLAHITDLFARRSREMPDRNRVQAMLPEGSRAIPNPRGTAPGIWIERDRGESGVCQLVAMPGVPSEMKRMFTHEVRPQLAGSGHVMRRALLHCFGVGESTAEEMLGELTARDHDPEVGITVHEATITLRVNASGASEAECLEKIERVSVEIRNRLGSLIFGEGAESLESVVVEGLIAGGHTLSTAEVGTGGVLASWLSDVDGSGGCFVGGQVLADAGGDSEAGSASGLRSLGVEWSKGAGNSESAARELATACRQHNGSDFALSVAECPAFDPDAPDQEAPTTWVACAGPGGVETRSLTLLGDVSFTRSRTAKTALDLLRRMLDECGA
jgi:nicotinamide-nucleotide amidase